MTIDLDAIEEKAKHQLQGPCTGMAHEVLDLVAELRQARAEGEWLAGVLQRMHVTLCEVGLEAGRLFPVDKTATEWLEAARFAVEKEAKK